MAAPPRRPILRALAAAWLVLAALVILALAGELWLRLEQREAATRLEALPATPNVFFANSMELNAGDRTLWAKPWFKYRPGARAEVVAGGERFVIQINSQGFRTHEFARAEAGGAGARRLHRRLDDRCRAHERRDLPGAARGEAARPLPGPAGRGAEPRA